MTEEGDLSPHCKWEGPYDDEGLPNGQGTMTYPPPAPTEEDEEEKPGDLFVGSMLHGQREGKGKYTWSSGAVFEGMYEANKKSGDGCMHFPDKGRYEGAWLEDMMHGDGTYYYANGDIYAGSFSQGSKHGRGTYYFKAHHCQFLGTWNQDQFVEGKWVHRDGTMFTGSFTNSMPDVGTFYFAAMGVSQAGCYKAAQGWQGGPIEATRA